MSFHSFVCTSKLEWPFLWNCDSTEMIPSIKKGLFITLLSFYFHSLPSYYMFLSSFSVSFLSPPSHYTFTSPSQSTSPLQFSLQFLTSLSVSKLSVYLFSNFSLYYLHFRTLMFSLLSHSTPLSLSMFLVNFTLNLLHFSLLCPSTCYSLSLCLHLFNFTTSLSLSTSQLTLLSTISFCFSSPVIPLSLSLFSLHFLSMISFYSLYILTIVSHSTLFTFTLNYTPLSIFWLHFPLNFFSLFPASFLIQLRLINLFSHSTFSLQLYSQSFLSHFTSSQLSQRTFSPFITHFLTPLSQSKLLGLLSLSSSPL